MAKSTTSPRREDPDAWLAKPQPTLELCRMFHGIGCRISNCGEAK